jgi:hypothetical protein
VTEEPSSYTTVPYLKFWGQATHRVPALPDQGLLELRLRYVQDPANTAQMAAARYAYYTVVSYKQLNQFT